MKTKHFLAGLAVTGTLALCAQPSYTNTEDFLPGMIFAYQQCATSGVLPGNSGSNVTWNFSNLAQAGTLTKSITTVSATPNGSAFPSSTIAEKHSGGTLLYTTKNASGNFLNGVVNTTQGFTMNYSTAYMSAKRQITMGSVVTGTYANTFTASGYSFIGKGSATLTADAYGTLILPTKTYSNVIRVRIESFERDSLVQFGTVSTATAVNFTWYDGVNPAPVLLMDSLAVSAGGVNSKNVSYLLSHNISTGLSSLSEEAALKCYPNPTNEELTITTPGAAELQVFNQLGVIMETRQVENITKISTGSYPPGIYFVNITNASYRRSVKLVVVH